MAAFAALIVLATTSSTQAQTSIDWVSTAATTAWATGTNWTGGTAPANDTTTNIANFNAASYLSQPNYGTTSVAGVTIGSSSAAVTFTGTTLTIGSSGIVNSSANAVTFGNAIAGTGAITQSGTGTLTLSAANTYSGGTTLNSGTIALANNTALGTGTITLNTGGTLTTTSRTLSNNFAITGTGSTLDIAGGTNTVLTGNITASSSGTATFTNTGTSSSLSLSKGSSYDWSGVTGTINYAKGTNNFNIIINTGNNGTFDMSNATLNFTGNNANSTNSIFAAQTGTNQTIKIGALSGTGGSIAGFNPAAGTVYSIGNTGTGTTTFGGVIGGGNNANTSLAKTGNSTQILSGLNTYTGSTTINGGTLQFGINNALAAGTAIKLGGGTLNLGGFTSNAFTNALTMTSSSTIDFGSHVTGLTLKFAASNAATWTGTLTLLDFTVGTDTLSFTSLGGITAQQLSQISLAGFTATSLDSNGNVQFTSAIPEPSTYAAILGALAFAGVVYQRRRAKAA